MAPDRKIVIIGVGNDLRSDDGVGPAVTTCLAKMNLPGIHIVNQVGDGTDMINAWYGADITFVIDCMQSGSDAGTIRRFEVGHDDIPEEILPGLSTHAFNITDTIRLARTIRQLPTRLVVYGIEGSVFSYGDHLSPAVAASASDVAESIRAEIAKIRDTIQAGSLGE
jgi:hydrogenase maturation protease